MSEVILPAAITTGVMFAVGLYLFLSWNIQRVVLGFVVFSNAVNLAVLSSSGLKVRGQPALIERGSLDNLVDPLPQALILTAIVIALGTAAFLLAMAIKFYFVSGRDDLRREVK